MTPKTKTSGSGDAGGGPSNKPSQKVGGIDASKSVSSAQDATHQAAQGGRAGSGSNGTTPAGTPPPAKTDPSSTPDQTKPAGTQDRGGDGNLQGKTNDPETPNRNGEDRVCKDDPIDIASGEMYLTELDAEILAALPFAVQRTHLSSYRVGLHFGASWTSTLDQRLEVGSAGISFVAEDGKLLFSPTPAPNTTVHFSGSRNKLTRHEDDGYTVTDVDSGLLLHFAPNDAVLPLRSIADRNGNHIDFYYDSLGSPVEIRHSGGARIRMTAEDGLITGLYLCEADSGEDLLLMRYEYADRRLVKVINPSGLAQEFGYDHAGRIVSWTDRNGTWYRYTYDHKGRCIRTEGADGILSGYFEYDSTNHVTRHTDSLGNTATFYLNEARQLVREIDPLGNETRSEWDSRDRLLSRTDPLGRTIKYEYDDAGNPITITRPDGSQTLLSYNDLGQVARVIPPDGSVWRRDYDERGNLVREIDPAGAATTYEYDHRGYATRVSNALGSAFQIENDDRGLPIAIADPLGNTTSYDRDAFGRLIETRDPMGRTTLFSWTVDGKPLSRTAPDGRVERWVYDSEGNLRTKIDPLEQATHTEIGAFDLPLAEVKPDGTRLKFAYDTELRLTGVTNEIGLTWQYEYDSTGNLVGETDFNGRTLRYRYDSAGQLIERINGAGEAINFIRDVHGNLIERRSGSTVDTFRYDAVGRLVEARNADAQVTFQRDLLGRVLRETTNGRSVTYTYDALGRRTKRRTPSGAESIWEYDENSQPITLHTAGRTLRFQYDAVGRETQRSLPSGVVLQQTWGSNDQLLVQALGSAKQRSIQQRSYRYRADGLLAGIDDLLTGPRVFELDRLGRVTSVHGNSWSEKYSYDPAGNIIDAAWPTANVASHGAEIGTREYNGTLIHRAGKVQYEHDAQGRVVLRKQKHLSHKSESWRYVWDADDRLVEIVVPDGTRWRYRYDPLGRRIAKQHLTPGGEHLLQLFEFTWDANVLAEQAHSAGRPNGLRRGDVKVTVWDYEPDSFFPVSQTERSPLRHAPQQWVDEQFYCIVTDLVGSPMEMINDNGGIAWFHRASLWGKTVEHSRGEAYTPLRFPGQYFDPESGFNYNYFRYYDSATGRYGSNDPIGLVGGLRPHGYVDNPTEFIDPLGLASKGGRRRKRCTEEIFERYGSKAEADSINDAGGKLTPKPEPHQNNPKWIGDQNTVDPRTLGQSKNYTHKFEIHAQPGTREWMKENNFETKPTNEPGRYEIPADKLAEFNSRVNNIVVTKR